MTVSICESLYRAQRAISRLIADQLFELGLGPGQDRVLVCVLHHDRVPSIQVARMLGLNRSTVSRLLRKLERASIVELIPGVYPWDRRIVDIRLTRLGLCLKKMLLDYPSWLDHELTSEWPAGEAEVLRRLLDELAARAESIVARSNGAGPEPVHDLVGVSARRAGDSVSQRADCCTRNKVREAGSDRGNETREATTGMNGGR